MKLNEDALKKSMDNAKRSFNKTCDKVMNMVKRLNKSVDAFKEEYKNYVKEEKHCCGGHCHCNHNADGDHVCHCQKEIEPEFNLENKDEE